MNEVEAVRKREGIQLVGRLLSKYGAIGYQDVWGLGINAAVSTSAYCP